MPRQIALSLGVFATGMMICALARAEEPQPQRGYMYFPPVKSAATYRPRAIVQQPAQQSSAAAVRTAPVQSYAFREAPVARSTAAVPYGYAVPSRPVSWGVRYGVGAGYPASLFGQVTAPADPQQPTPAPSQPTTPAYAQPNYGNGSMYLGTPSTTPVTGYSSIYGYAGRFYGPYYGYGPSYYSYGGMGGWGTPYNAGYYGSGCYGGCYGVNACCRASQRYCTPFGGMFRGCGSGCYIPTPPPCPTACAYADPCGPVTGTPAPGTLAPTPSAAPQTYDSPSPTPSNVVPPTPQPPATQDAVSPVEKRVIPAPQAKNFPRIPELAPDA